MPMSMPARDGVIEERRVHRLAHLVVAAEAERDVGDAAAHLGVRQVLLDPARGLDEVHRVVVVLLDAGGDGENVGIEDDVFGRKADLVHQDAVGALADADLVRVGRGLALARRRPSPRPPRRTSEPSRRCWRNFSSPSFSEIEFTMPLPCRHFSPASMTSHFEESTMNGTLATSGSLAEQLQEARHGRDAVDHALVHADVDDVRAVLDLLPRDADGFLVFAFLDRAWRTWASRRRWCARRS